MVPHEVVLVLRRRNTELRVPGPGVVEARVRLPIEWWRNGHPDLVLNRSIAASLRYGE
jgi:hypothetical protein